MIQSKEQAPFPSVTLTEVIQDVTLLGQPCFCDSEVSAEALGPFNHDAEEVLVGQKPYSSSQEASYISSDWMLHLNFCLEVSIYAFFVFLIKQIFKERCCFKNCLRKETLTGLCLLFNWLIALRYCFERDTPGGD